MATNNQQTYIIPNIQQQYTNTPHKEEPSPNYIENQFVEQTLPPVTNRYHLQNQYNYFPQIDPLAQINEGHITHNTTTHNIYTSNRQTNTTVMLNTVVNNVNNYLNGICQTVYNDINHTNSEIVNNTQYYENPPPVTQPETLIL